MPTKQGDKDNQLSRAIASLEIEKQTDRGAAIIVCTILDETLRQAIEARLYKLDPPIREGSNGKELPKDLFRPYGPFGGFGNRIDVARSLGLIIDDIWRDLLVMSRIRNDFAHSMAKDESELSFDTSEIAKKCEELWSADLDIATTRKKGEISTPRDRYLHAAEQINAWFVAEVKNANYKLEPYRWGLNTA